MAQPIQTPAAGIQIAIDQFLLHHSWQTQNDVIQRMRMSAECIRRALSNLNSVDQSRLSNSGLMALLMEVEKWIANPQSPSRSDLYNDSLEIMSKHFPHANSGSSRTGAEAAGDAITSLSESYDHATQQNDHNDAVGSANVVLTYCRRVSPANEEAIIRDQWDVVERHFPNLLPKIP